MSMSWEYIILYGESDFTDVVKDTEMGKSSWITQLDPKQSQRSLQDGGRRIRGREKTEGREQKSERREDAAGFEDRRKGHKPRNAGDLQKLKKARTLILP